MTKVTEQRKVKCKDCANAVLMQWDKNPVIAQCGIRGGREVANTVRVCCDFKKVKSVKPIIHYTRN